MKSLFICFRIMLEQMFHDFMLSVVLFVPIVTAILLKFGIPLLETYLTATFSLPQILTPYYALIDCGMLVITPVMFNFTTAMVMLEERDEHIITYVSITPLTKNGYLFARLGFINILSFFFMILISKSCSLVGFPFFTLFFISICFLILGLLISLLIITFSSNKMEGMTIGKLTSLLTIGFIIPLILHSPIQYLFACMPTYWLGKFILQENYVCLFLALLISMLQLYLLYKQFLKKFS